MTKLLEEVVEDERALSDDEQERVAQALIAFMRDLQGLPDRLSGRRAPKKGAPGEPHALPSLVVRRQTCSASGLLRDRAA